MRPTTIIILASIITILTHSSFGNKTTPGKLSDSTSQLIEALARKDSIDIIEKLITSADLNASDNDGYTVLDYAVMLYSDANIIDLLVRHGADVNAADENGCTVLMGASLDKNPDFIERLIKYGADINARDNDGTSALGYATMYNENPYVSECLINLGAGVAEGNSSILINAAVNNSNPDIIDLLVKHGANVNAKNDRGATALILAAGRASNPDVLEHLVEQGADINGKLDNGSTALSYAAALNSSPEIIDRLIQLGADVHAKSDTGATALAVAAELNKNPQVIERLIQHGADPNGKESGRLAQHFLVQSNNVKAVEWGERGAWQGDAQAATVLGFCHFFGRGLIENYTEGYAWYLIASMNGYDKAIEDLPKLRSLLTPQQISVGQQRAQELQRQIVKQSKLGSLSPDKNTASVGVKPSGYGSGLLVEGGYVLTCWHVVESANTVTVSMGGQDHVVKVVRKDPGNDIAVLYGDTLSGGVSLSTSSEVGLGKKVFTLGYPHPKLQGSGVKFTTGSISGLMGPQDTPLYYQISAPVQSGNSGGPLFDEGGNLVGVVAAKLDSLVTLMATGDLPQNVNYAIKVDYVTPLLKTIDGIKLGPAQPQSSKLLGLIDDLKQSVVMIKVY